jgi:hypothetical protein
MSEQGEQKKEGHICESATCAHERINMDQALLRRMIRDMGSMVRDIAALGARISALEHPGRTKH